MIQSWYYLYAAAFAGCICNESKTKYLRTVPSLIPACLVFFGKATEQARKSFEEYFRETAPARQEIVECLDLKPISCEDFT